MKKMLALVFVLLLTLSLVAACGGGGSKSGEAVTLATVKVGFVHVSDPSDMGYTYNHDLGTQKMMAALNLKDAQVINKFNISEDSSCDTAIRELVEAGCNIIFATSFGFENYMIEVAKEHPEIQFCHATGYQAASSKLPNMHNYFGSIYQARYLSGIAAGLKTKTNKLGYVSAMPFAECISGYDGFYLGALSVNPNVTMDVIYTNSWNDPTAESRAAQALIDRGCDVIGQHCDSPSPQTTAEANGKWGVGYNSDMIAAAPNAALTSAIWDWSIYLTFAVQNLVNGAAIPTDWSGGLKEGVCDVSQLNEDIIAPGTAAAIEAARQKILGGWDVFTGPLHGVNSNGEEKTLAAGEVFTEPASAPSWDYILDGITVVE